MRPAMADPTKSLSPSGVNSMPCPMPCRLQTGSQVVPAGTKVSATPQPVANTSGNKLRLARTHVHVPHLRGRSNDGGLAVQPPRLVHGATGSSGSRARCRHDGHNKVFWSKGQWRERCCENPYLLIIDLLQFESAFLTDSSNLILQELAYKNAIRNLNVLLGVNVERNWNLTDELTPPMNVYYFDDLNQKMLSNNSNIKNQLINFSLLKQDIEMAKSAFYPSLIFNSGGNYSNSRFAIGNLEQKGTSINYYGNFTLSFRLYDGGKVRRGIKALKIQEEVNYLEMEKLKNELTQDLAINFDTYQTRFRIFELNKKSFQVSQQNFDIAKIKENSGLMSSFNLRDIEMAYLTAGIALFQSTFNLIESNTTLLKLTGGIVQDFSE